MFELQLEDKKQLVQYNYTQLINLITLKINLNFSLLQNIVFVFKKPNIDFIHV